MLLVVASLKAVKRSSLKRQWNVNMTSNVIMKLESPVTTAQVVLLRLTEHATFICLLCSSTHTKRFDRLLNFAAQRVSFIL